MRHGIPHEVSIPKEIYNNGKITIKDDVWIGECASILSGVTV
jgi:acetyltransferase-like isoleucine patch superfamily enzyme